MPPKGNKQAIADRRSQKQQKLQEQWDEEEEESWDDSQAEEVSDEEEMESWESLDEELEDKPPKDEEEEIIASAAAPSSKEPARSQPPTGKVGPSPPRPGLLKASRRWDTVSIAGSPPAPVGKQPQTRRGYCSWRPYKSNIVACLQHCRGNISFARRYLLFHDGVAVPRNVLYYYRHLYSPYETLGENNSAA